MAIRTFAAIYIGSYEVGLKIFEISQKKLKKIDHIRSRVELGKDAYRKGVIGYELVEELCQVLKGFGQIMDSYKVDDCRVCASSLFQDVSNEWFVLDQIRQRTKLAVQVLSNSEQRFISYKSLAYNPVFERLIQESAAVVDVGGGSVQVTLYFGGRAVTTQQIVLGLMRIREKLSAIQGQVVNYEELVQEMVDKELEIFCDLYLKEKKVKYIIMVGDYIGDMVKNIQRRNEDDTIEAERFLKAMKKLQKKNSAEVASALGYSNEQDPLLIPSVVLYRRLAEATGGDYVWVPGVNISDGIAYDYAQKNKILKPAHDFEGDILSAARALAARYQSKTEHTETLTEAAAVIFDAMKTVHGLGKRERLLLMTAAILHDCGRYISLVNQAECSYQIIMASEIIGVSHLEREIAATAGKYISAPLAAYEELKEKLDQESYLVAAKLSAILKLANAMDRSHRQKFKKVRAALKEKQLVITVETSENFVLEKRLFQAYTEAFEQVFSIEPVLREKRI